MSESIRSPYFTGSIPVNYDRYMGPMFFEDYAIEIANRIDTPAVKFALELSCGTGRVTNHIRRVLQPTAKLVASDVSPDMMAVAKEKLKGTVVEWKSIDFNQIPYDDNSLDLVVCSFGYMFADDKVKAFAEALRVLTPGGNLIISTWDKLEYNEASDVFRRIIKKYFGDSLPVTYRIPYSMYDPEEIVAQLEQAGFSRVKIDVIDKKSVSESAKLATIGMVQGGSLYNEIMKRDPAWLDQISGEVEKELSDRFGAAPMVAGMRALVAVGWK